MNVQSLEVHEVGELGRDGACELIRRKGPTINKMRKTQRRRVKNQLNTEHVIMNGTKRRAKKGSQAEAGWCH